MEKVTTYRELADALFDKIKDRSFLDISQDLAYEIVINYIRPAIVKFQGCTQNLQDRDDILRCFNFKLTDDSFEILVNYMVIEWLTSNYLLTGQTLKSRMSAADFHKIDTKDMLGKVTELRNILKAENDQLAVSKSYCPETSKLYNIIMGGKKV